MTFDPLKFADACPGPHTDHLRRMTDEERREISNSVQQHVVEPLAEAIKSLKDDGISEAQGARMISMNPDEFAAKTDTQKLDAIATVLAIDIGERIGQIVPPELRTFTLLNLRQITRIAAEKLQQSQAQGAA